MFYKFNNLIGRITPSTQAEAYCPQGLSTAVRGPSVIIFDSKKTKVARVPLVTPRPVGVAGAAPGVESGAVKEALGVVPSNPRYQKIMKMQNIFLKPDGKLVWQKLRYDHIGYIAALGLMAVGTLFSFRVLYKMSYPPATSDTTDEEE